MISASRGFWKLSVNALGRNAVAHAFWNAAWSALIRAFAEAGIFTNLLATVSLRSGNSGGTTSSGASRLTAPALTRTWRRPGSSSTGMPTRDSAVSPWR